ncbi:MAG: aldo/keto reductase [Acidimicrobiia bacterium]|nr:aldo/keto reductase [Acidimicrobiia bacterium]MDH3464113.1 aldo/keto reductase [Acidimicrobiia bacterium]
MEERRLGSSDLRLSVFGLGTMTFGDEADEATSHAILDRYVEAGGTLIDTADVYTRGVSEEIIGRWMATHGNRADLTIATKARFSMSDDPADQGAGRKHLERALEASLRRLRVDVIDLYQIHAWDPETPIEETLETLDGFVRAGKVRALGVSNFLGWQMERAFLISQYESWAPVVSLQPQYNLLSREIELELLPLCLDRGIGLLPWSPLGGGWLTGKYSRETAPTGASRLGEDPNRGIEAYDLKNTDHTWRILDVVGKVAAEREATMSQVALNWVRQRPGITSVLLGCRTVAQLNDNLGALDWDLSAEEMALLDQVSAPGIPLYPQGFIENEASYDVWEKLTTRVKPAY